MKKIGFVYKEKNPSPKVDYDVMDDDDSDNLEERLEQAVQQAEVAAKKSNEIVAIAIRNKKLM